MMKMLRLWLGISLEEVNITVKDESPENNRKFMASKEKGKKQSSSF